MVLPARHSVHHHFHTLCRFSHFIYISTKDIYVIDIFIFSSSSFPKGGLSKEQEFQPTNSSNF